MERKPFVKGAYDIHFHTSPDVVKRKCSDMELARRAKEAGMAGFVIKNHYTDTAGRAAVLQELCPELKIAGGITLNRSVGGLNPQAVEKMARMGGKMVWFPTLESLEYQKFRNPGKKAEELPEGLLTVFEQNGELKQEVYEILKLCTEYDLAVGTGHMAAKEGLAVIAAGKAAGVKRMIVTHADNPADAYTVEQQKEAVSMGAFIEHCYFTTYYNRVSASEICRQIGAVGTNHVILSTDFGQTESPHSDEGLEEYGSVLMAEGIPEEAIREMMCRNPEKLLWE